MQQGFDHELDKLLSNLHSVYGLLLEQTEQYERAVRAANIEQVSACAARQRGLNERIAELELRRRELLAPWTDPLQDTHAGPGIQEVIKKLPEAAHNRLNAKADALRALVSIVASKTASARSATSWLMNHMEGLMLEVSSKLSDSVVYERRGRVRQGTSVATGLDLTL